VILVQVRRNLKNRNTLQIEDFWLTPTKFLASRPAIFVHSFVAVRTIASDERLDLHFHFHFHHLRLRFDPPSWTGQEPQAHECNTAPDGGSAQGKHLRVGWGNHVTPRSLQMGIEPAVSSRLFPLIGDDDHPQKASFHKVKDPKAPDVLSSSRFEPRRRIDSFSPSTVFLGSFPAAPVVIIIVVVAVVVVIIIGTLDGVVCLYKQPPW